MDSFTSVQATWDSVKSTTEYRNFRPLGGHSVVGEAFRACLSRVRGEFLPSPHLENLTPSPENSSIAVLNSTPQRTLLRAPQSTETFDLWAVNRPRHLGPTARVPHALLYSEDSPIAVLKSTPAPQNAKLPHERREQRLSTPPDPPVLPATRATPLPVPSSTVLRPALRRQPQLI